MKIPASILILCVCLYGCKEKKEDVKTKIINEQVVPFEILSDTSFTLGIKSRLSKSKHTETGALFSSLKVQITADTIGYPGKVVDYFMKIDGLNYVMSKQVFGIKYILSDFTEHDNHLYTISTHRRTMGGYTKDRINKYDNEWNLIWSKEIDSPKFPDGNSFLKITKNNSIIYVSDRLNESGKRKEYSQEIIICTYSLDGEQLSSKTFHHRKFNNPQSLVESIDGNFILTTFSFDEYKKYLAEIMKIDPSGNILWRKTIDSVIPVETIAATGNEFILFGEHKQENEAGLIIVRLDTNGKILWRKTSSPYYYFRMRNLVKGNNEYLLSNIVESKKDGLRYSNIISVTNDGKIVEVKKFKISPTTFEAPILFFSPDNLLMLSNLNDSLHLSKLSY